MSPDARRKTIEHHIDVYLCTGPAAADVRRESSEMTNRADRRPHTRPLPPTRRSRANI